MLGTAADDSESSHDWLDEDELETRHRPPSADFAVHEAVDQSNQNGACSPGPAAHSV